MPTDLRHDVETAGRLRFATMRLARLLRQHADPDSGLSQSLLSALTSINRVGPVTLGQLASIERVQPPSMTRIIDQLEARGLVVREIDEADRRVARVRLLPPADTLIAELRTRKTEYLASRLADLTTAELDALEAALPALEHLAGVSQ
jgi:DNA-binding MarR family transcriptional regulator